MARFVLLLVFFISSLGGELFPGISTLDPTNENTTNEDANTQESPLGHSTEEKPVNEASNQGEDFNGHHSQIPSLSQMTKQEDILDYLSSILGSGQHKNYQNEDLELLSSLMRTERENQKGIGKGKPRTYDTLEDLYYNPDEKLKNDFFNPPQNSEQFGSRPCSQINYYYNFYLSPDKRLPIKLDMNKLMNSEENERKDDGSSETQKIKCEQYFELLKHVIQKLEETQEYDYDGDEYGTDFNDLEAFLRTGNPTELHPTLPSRVSQSNRSGLIPTKSPLGVDEVERFVASTETDPRTTTDYSEPNRNKPKDGFELNSTPRQTTTWYPVPSTKFHYYRNYDFLTTTLPYVDGNYISTTEDYARTSHPPVEDISDHYLTPYLKQSTASPRGFFYRAQTTNPDWVSRMDYTSSYDTQTAAPPFASDVGTYEHTTVSTVKMGEVECVDKMLPCPDTINVTYPLNGYCNRYVTCESGKAIRRVCTDGLHFNPITKNCDVPHNSICAYGCPATNGIYGIPGDCSGYFICKNSALEYRMCPPKMHWDVKTGLCLFEDQSSCPMKCAKENQIKSYPGDCEGYITCFKGVPYYHKCPPKMKFDSVSLTCIPGRMSSCLNHPKLLMKTENPNMLCDEEMKKIGAKTWWDNVLSKRTTMSPDVK